MLTLHVSTFKEKVVRVRERTNMLIFSKALMEIYWVFSAWKRALTESFIPGNPKPIYKRSELPLNITRAKGQVKHSMIKLFTDHTHTKKTTWEMITMMFFCNRKENQNWQKSLQITQGQHRKAAVTKESDTPF